MSIRKFAILFLWLLAGCAAPPLSEERPLEQAAPTMAKSEVSRRDETTKPSETKTKMRPEKTESSAKVVKTEAEWKKILTPEQYRVLREKGTEYAFTGKFWDNHESGTYACAGCGQELFQSTTKFESGCGWPSFFESLDPSKITLEDDHSLGMHRTEVMCSRCGGHLGHVFDDGPRPTGKRFCINSASLTFKKAE